MSDPYQILGVSRDTPMDEIKQAYRRLARRYHPDVSKEPNAEERFKEIQNAYDQIKNPQPQQPHNNFGFDFGSFSDFVNRTRFKQNVIVITLSLEECYSGTEKIIENQKIYIQPGVRSGTKLLLNDQTIVQIQVLPHRKFQRNNDDLLVIANITVAEAIMGTQIEIEHLNGKKYNVKVPSGIQHQQAIKLGGLGLTNPRHPHQGDLFVQFSVSIPDNSALTQEQKQAIMSTGFRKKITV